MAKAPVGFLRQTAIANFGKAPPALQGQERVLYLGAYDGLAPVHSVVGFRQGPVSVGTLIGEILRLRRKGREPRALK